jgi:hypothetical protein
VDEFSVPRTPGNLQGAILLFLSLNLILLVFFTLLNVMATPSIGKTEKVASNVPFSFENKPIGLPGNGGTRDTPPPAWMGWLESSLLEPVAGNLAISPNMLMADATRLWVTLPMANFFEGESAALLPTQTGPLENIAALSSLPGQTPLQLEVAVRMPAEQLPLAAARALALGRALSSRLGPNLAVATQIAKQGEDAAILFTFRGNGMAGTNAATRIERQMDNQGANTEWQRESAQ